MGFDMRQDSIKKLMVIFGFWLIASTGSYGGILEQGSTLVALEKNDILEVKVHSLVVDPKSHQPVVSLSDLREDRSLLIWIDFFEARAIYSELEGVKHFRPLTHDLLEKIIEKVNGNIHHIVITHVKENTYYATIFLKRGDTLVEVDARPSDSIVMALKFKAPIYVAKSLFEKMSFPIGEQKESEDEYGLTFQDLTPELAQYLSFESKHGVLVSNVRKGSNAAKDGVETGDIFVEIGGKTIEDVTSMKDSLSKSKTPVKARVFRKARFLTIVLHPQQ